MSASSFPTESTCLLDLKSDPKLFNGVVGMTAVSGLVAMICAGLLITASYSYANLRSSDQQAYVVVGIMSLLLSLGSFILIWVLWSKKRSVRTKTTPSVGSATHSDFDFDHPSL
jgi:hypothetical protein